MQGYQLFRWKEANFRIHATRPDLVISEIKKQRRLLGIYLRGSPEFKISFVPVRLLSDAPEIVCRMHQASLLTGVGPMAAVAGTVAQLAVEAALKGCAPGANTAEAVVDNGGDIYLAANETLEIGLYAGQNSISGKLALRITPEQMPLAVCSSSSTMGHSLSFGDCDLATVVSKDGALADAAATLLCNSVKSSGDLESTLEKAMSIPGVLGALLVKDEHIGMVGDLPELIKNEDSEGRRKIPRCFGSEA